MKREIDTAAIDCAVEYLRSMRAESRIKELKNSYATTLAVATMVSADFLALYSEELDRAREARVVEET